MNDIGHWKFFKKFEPADWIGFIYRVIDLDTEREYIGKKFFTSSLRKKVKNRKNRKKVVKESNWKSYTGSCKELNAEIELRGKDRFEFKIESLHESRSSLAYREVELHVKENVMREKLPSGVKKYYNGMIPPVKFRVLDETANELKFRTKK
jgi:hypothetical protein